MIARILLSIFLLLAQASWANVLVPGETPPDLLIEQRGEIVLAEEEFAFQPWRYPQQMGKVHVVNYMAATRSASKLNQPFTDRLQLALDEGSYHVTTILNLDDALWGTTGMVVREIKSNKRKHPGSTLVLDEEAVGLRAWQLERKNSAIVIVDGTGTIRYVKQGAMSEEEIERAIEMIRSMLGSKTS